MDVSLRKNLLLGENLSGDLSTYAEKVGKVDHDSAKKVQHFFSTVSASRRLDPRFSGDTWARLWSNDQVWRMLQREVTEVEYENQKSF